MRFIFLLSLSSILFYSAHAQRKTSKCICYEGNHLPSYYEWADGWKYINKPGTDITISKWFIDPSSNKVVIALFPLPSHSFDYFRFDSLGNTIESGELTDDSLHFDSLEYSKPDWQNDPDGAKGLFKDTLLINYYHVKDGYWKEEDSLGYTWIGNYNKGCREGYWRRGKYLRIDSIISEREFFVYYRIRYEDGKVDSSSFSNFSNFSWQSVKGKWYLDKMKGDTMVLNMEPKGQRFKFNFISKDKCQYPHTSELLPKEAIRTADWDIDTSKTPSITLYDGLLRYKYEVLEYSLNHLILIPFSEESKFNPDIFLD